MALYQLPKSLHLTKEMENGRKSCLCASIPIRYVSSQGLPRSSPGLPSAAQIQLTKNRAVQLVTEAVETLSRGGFLE